MLTAARARELLEYDPETGVLRWRVANSNRVKVGDVAGYINVDWRRPDKKYVRVRLDGQKYYAHVVIWIHVTGLQPVSLVDHEDGDGSNNRWSNLRAATNTQNAFNSRTRRDSLSGVKGVYHDTVRRKWVAHLNRTTIGRFNTQEEAASAVQKKREEFHGEFARHD